MKIKIDKDEIKDLLDNPHRIIEIAADAIQGETDFKNMGFVLFRMQEVLKQIVFNSGMGTVYIAWTITMAIAHTFVDAKTTDAEIINAMLSDRLNNLYKKIDRDMKNKLEAESKKEPA